MPRSEAHAEIHIPFLGPARSAVAQEYGPARKLVICQQCRGRGQVNDRRGLQQLCPACKGAGKTATALCPLCKGKGTAWSERPVQIRIPAGVETGARLQVRGMGLQGRDGGAAGDFMIVVHVEKHPFFERDGLDIICAVPISFYQAMLGGYVTVPALEGVKKIKIKRVKERG